MPDDFRPTVVESAPIALETHGFGANLLFDENGLGPYWGLTAAYDPDHEDCLNTFEAIGEEWEIVQSEQWYGQLAPPDEAYDAVDDGLLEFQYQVQAVDDIGDKDATIQFRPGYPEPVNAYSGNPIQGMPSDCPKSIRVQFISTNLDHDEVLPLLRSLADHIGLNPDYFGEPHEYSSVYQLERYARLSRALAEANLTGDGGLIDQLGDFASSQGGRGMYKWDHEDVQAHYEAVAFDPDTWGILIPEQFLGKQLKCYHPKHVRDAASDDPLADPKVEISLSNEYDREGNVPWHDIDAAIADLDDALHNVLHWADIPITADPDVWNGADPYFDVKPADQSVTLQHNPLPEFREATEDLVETELVSQDITAADQDLILALTDGGPRHYETLAEDADRSTSAVYRLVDKLSALLDTENGIVQWADEYTREYAREIIEPLRDTARWASDALRDAVDREHIHSDGEPSALEQWMQRHGLSLVGARQRLHFSLDRPTSRRELVKILRAGLEAAEASGLESEFRDALIDWQERGEGSRRNWQAYNEGLPLGIGSRYNNVSYTR